jgi:localization factor PodJL
MTSGAYKSARYLDPTSRQAAEDLARRSGMTLNEWVSRLMAEGPEDATSQDYFTQGSPNFMEAPRSTANARYETYSHPADEVGRVADAIERLSDRIESAESRQALAIAGVERSVRDVIARIDAAEREQMQIAARIDNDIAESKGEGSRLADRLRRMEEEAVGPRSVEALKALEGAIGNVAGHVYEGERRARDGIADMRNRVERLDSAEQATVSAIRELKTTCAGLDERLKLVNEEGSEGVAKIAENLSNRVEAVREELSQQLAAVAEARFDRVDQALAQMGEHVRAAEQRSASAIERMGREVLEVAQTLNRRVQTVERNGNEIAERFGADVNRMAGAVEARLVQSDNIQAAALEKLGGEIARITERLADRIASAERRSAQAIDDVGEQVARVTERIGQRHERSNTELADRIRQSEERTAKLLEEARQKIDERLAEVQRRAEPVADYDEGDDLFADSPFAAVEPPPPAERPYFRPTSYIPPQAVAPPAEAPQFEDEDFEAVAEFASPMVSMPADARHEDFLVDDLVGEAPHELAEEMTARAELGPEAGLEAIGIEAVGIAAGAAPVLAESALETDPVVLEPNVGFDMDDDFEAAPISLAEEHPAETSAEAEHETTVAEPTAELHAFAEDAPVDEDLFDASEAELAPTEAVVAPLTTRDVIERARAAARANDRNRRRPSPNPADDVLSGLTFGRSRRRTGPPTGALMVASLVAAISLGAGGYMLFEAQPGGKLPQRVEDALAAVRGVAPATTPAAQPTPLAAVAFAPKPATNADVAAAYSAAVSKITANEADGVDELTKLADGGYAPAQFYLAELFQDGKAGLKKDPSLSRQWLEKAAEGGDRTAMHNLALDLHEGVGGAADAVQSAEWFRRAAELGLLDSQFNLAAIYEHGDGVSQNPAEAYKWYLIAARSGDAEARAGALRVRSGLTPDARAVAEQAAADFQPTTVAAQTAGAGTAPAAAPPSPDIVTAQRALNQLGYYQGPTDGSPSPALHLAIAAYQRDQSLPVTGATDPTTIGKLAVYTK